MDAVPVTLGQEFDGFAAQIRLGAERVRDTLGRVGQIPLGGTATGTGINTHAEFAERVRAKLTEATGLEISAPEDPFEAQANRDALVELSGALKVVAVSMIKIANDLALMGSGPRAGLAEIRLPELQKGSSIMPGKVNPVIPEVVIQVGDQVIGNDAAIAIAGTQGQFELNVRVPLIARNLLDSIKLLAAAARLLDKRCVSGIEPNEEMLQRHAESTLQVATALNPHIGYDKADRDRQGGGELEPHRARGRDRARRRRGGARRGARLRQDGPAARLSDVTAGPFRRPTDMTENNGEQGNPVRDLRRRLLLAGRGAVPRARRSRRHRGRLRGRRDREPDLRAGVHRQRPGTSRSPGSSSTRAGSTTPTWSRSTSRSTTRPSSTARARTSAGSTAR